MEVTADQGHLHGSIPLDKDQDHPQELTDLFNIQGHLQLKGPADLIEDQGHLQDLKDPIKVLIQDHLDLRSHYQHLGDLVKQAV